MTDLTDSDIGQITTFLYDCCERVLRWLPTAPAWEPAWQRCAAQEELANAEVGPAGPWAERPVRTVYGQTAGFLAATVDCLHALADVVDPHITAYVPNVLARAAMEAGAQAWWLLEPGIGARRRVIRSVLIRAASARRLAENVGKVDPAAVVTDYGEDDDAVRAYADALGLTYTINGHKVECEGERLPSYTNRAEAFAAANLISGAYAVYSGAAHAEWHAVVQGWRPDPAAAPTGRWTRRPDRAAVWAAVIASSGYAVVPARRALTLLGRTARLVEIDHYLERIGNLQHQLGLAGG